MPSSQGIVAGEEGAEAFEEAAPPAADTADVAEVESLLAQAKLEEVPTKEEEKEAAAAKKKGALSKS